MAMPAAIPEIMLGQALDESTLTRDALSRDPSSIGPTMPVTMQVSPIQGTKRKADHMENVETPESARQTCPPIKLEPGSPNHFDDKGSNIRDTHRGLYEKSRENMSSSSSDSTEDEGDGPATTGPFRTTLAAGVRLNMSSKDMSTSLKQETEAHTTGDAKKINHEGTNRLLCPLPKLDKSPPPHRQKVSGRSENPRRYTGKTVEEWSYNSIPDYTPPISTLPRGNPHILYVVWRQKTLDLSNDPDRQMLHEAELKLAETLNLSCAKYLCTKRRIFQARFQALKAGREFKKTDYQKASKINSNKASKLCTAFEKVGWFDEKYFLKYLYESYHPMTEAKSRDNDVESISSGLTEPDIWDVSESEFHFSSEVDEESTDGDTADSSVSFDSKKNETEGQRNSDLYRDTSYRKQNHGLSLIGGDGSQRRVLIDKTVQKHDTISGNGMLNEGLTLEKTVNPPNGLSGDYNEEAAVPETRSMTQKIKHALNSVSGDHSVNHSIKAKSIQQKSKLEEFDRHAPPTNRFVARKPMPRSLDEANAAEIMLVKMREQGRLWPEIQSALEKETGKAQKIRALSARYTHLRANFARTRIETGKASDSRGSLTNPLLEPEDDQLLLAAEAEIEENFQREKADIIAEMEENFHSEKWNLVAEAMSRTGSAHHSAEFIQAQYERLARGLERTDDKGEENADTLDELPPRTTRIIKGGMTEKSSPQSTGFRRLDEASNITKSPQPQHTIHLYQKRPNSKDQAITTIRKTAPVKSVTCKKCGRKYKSPGGLMYHQAHHPNCELLAPKPSSCKKRKLIVNPPAPRVSFPNLMPRQTPTALPQAERTENAPVPQTASLGSSAKGVEGGRQTVRKHKPETHAEQSERAKRVWALRRALGTSGRYGGPPKATTIAKQAKLAVSNATPNARIALAPTVTHQTDYSPEPLPKQKRPILVGKGFPRNATQQSQKPAKIVPAAARANGGPEHNTPSRKHGTKRHTCRKCGMSYTNRANHYRVLPNIGSEHKRRMAANAAAAEGHAGPAITDVGAKSTSDVSMGQMVFEISSREQSAEPQLSRGDRELLGEIVD